MSKLALDYVVLLGSGPWQRSLFDLMKSNGLEVCTISPTHTYLDSDCHILKDIRDITGIINEITKRNIQPRIFISSQTDLAVYSCAKLNHHFNIGVSNLEAATNFTNKFVMRSLINQCHIKLKNPTYQKVTCRADLDKIMDGSSVLLQDVIIKPTSLQSSLGVRYIQSLNNFDFDSYRAEMSNYDVNEFILEKNIKGSEYTLEGYKSKNGSHELLAVSKKDKKFGFGVANALHYSPDAFRECLPLTDSLNQLFSSHTFGPTHTEVMKTAEGNFYLIEAAIRGGGSGIPSEIVPSLTGFYPEYQLLKDTGISCKKNSEVTRHDYVSLVFYEFNTDVASSLRYSDVKRNILRTWSNYEDGEVVGKISDDRSRHGFVITGSDSEVERQEIMARIATLNPGINFHA